MTVTEPAPQVGSLLRAGAQASELPHPGLRTVAPSLSAACLSKLRLSGVSDPGGHWHTPGTLVRIQGET